MNINPYLNFNGTCAEAFRFYTKVLGGKDLQIMTFGDIPPGEEAPPMAESEKGLVMHARFTVGDVAIMGSDAPGGRYNKPQGLSVSIGVDTPDEAERIFVALAEGGDIGMPIGETFWAKRFGMVKDRFGTPWMVNCE